MAQVKITEAAESPAAKLVAAGNKTVDVIDALGRTITLKKPDILAQYDMIDALGESAKNQAYLGMVLPLIFVTAIDGQAVSSPDTKGEIRALIKRLEETGVAAAMAGVQEHFAVDDQGEAVKKSSE